MGRKAPRSNLTAQVLTLSCTLQSAVSIQFEASSKADVGCISLHVGEMSGQLNNSPKV